MTVADYRSKARLIANPTDDEHMDRPDMGSPLSDLTESDDSDLEDDEVEDVFVADVARSEGPEADAEEAVAATQEQAANEDDNNVSDSCNDEVQVPRGQEDDEEEETLGLMSVEATFSKAFRSSPFIRFVPYDLWDKCERDEHESWYALEEVRQRLLSYCAPGKSQWLCSSTMPNLLFMHLPIAPLNVDSGFMSASMIHGLLRVSRKSTTPYQSVAGSDSLLLKVIYGAPDIDICGNTTPLLKVAVNHQVLIPAKSIFSIKNDEWDEVVIYYVSRDDSAIDGTM